MLSLSLSLLRFNRLAHFVATGWYDARTDLSALPSISSAPISGATAVSPAGAENADIALLFSDPAVPHRAELSSNGSEGLSRYPVELLRRCHLQPHQQSDSNAANPTSAGIFLFWFSLVCANVGLFDGKCNEPIYKAW